MSDDRDKDVIDHLCAHDPHWVSALQIVQLAMKQGKNDPVQASAQIVCALVILAAEASNPKEFLDYCADELRKTPLNGKRAR